MSTLFSEADAYSGDPLAPDMIAPTPVEVVASLTPTEREERVTHLIEQAHAILEEGIAEHLRGREIVAKAVLFSGGNDSTTLAHIFKGEATHAITRPTGFDWGTSTPDTNDPPTEPGESS